MPNAVRGELSLREIMPRSSGRLLESWTLEPLRSRGELAARHWLLGGRELPLSAVAGRMSVQGHACEQLWLHLRCTVPGSAPADVALHVPAAALDAVISTVAGNLHVNGRKCPIELRLHDLGTSPAAGAVPPRRFLVFSADLHAELRPVRELWRGFQGNELKLFAHTVWTRSAYFDDAPRAA